jgi:hypothetical protein
VSATRHPDIGWAGAMKPAMKPIMVVLALATGLGQCLEQQVKP